MLAWARHGQEMGDVVPDKASFVRGKSLSIIARKAEHESRYVWLSVVPWSSHSHSVIDKVTWPVHLSSMKQEPIPADAASPSKLAPECHG